MNDTDTREGGCHCGKVRYRVSGAAEHSLICNCASCRGASGAQNVAYFVVPKERFEWLSEEPPRYASSPGVERGFCSSCGTSLSFEAPYIEGLIDVTVASLDDPEAFPPTAHVNDRHALSWSRTQDALPRFAEFPE